jgi:hypothetical protein
MKKVFPWGKQSHLSSQKVIWTPQSYLSPDTQISDRYNK